MLWGKTARYAIAFFLIISLNFAIPRAMPGDTLTNLMGEDVHLSEDAMLELKAKVGVDQPIHIQFLNTPLPNPIFQMVLSEVIFVFPTYSKLIS